MRRAVEEWLPCMHGRVASGVGSRLRPATQLRSHRLSCVCVRSLSPRRRNARAYLGQLIPNYHSACSPVFRMPLRIHVGDENCEEVRDPRESGSQEEDPQGAICMHLSCTPPEFCLVTLSIREHDHGA